MKISNDSKGLYKINDVLIKDVTRQKFLVLDIEATGLNIKKDYITEFACVPVVEGKIVNDKAFSSLINSPVPIPDKIEKFTGITNADISKAPRFRKVITDILEKYEDYIWIAQCGLEFDFPMLENICGKEKLAFTPQKMDTKVLFTFLNQESSQTFSTDFLKSYFQIDASDLKRHTGLGDTILVARILERILEVYKREGVNEVKVNKPLTIKKFIPKKL